MLCYYDLIITHIGICSIRVRISLMDLANLPTTNLSNTPLKVRTWKTLQLVHKENTNISYYLHSLTYIT